jgi:protein SCO1/2
MPELASRQTLHLLVAFVCGFAAITGGLFAYQKFSRAAIPPTDLPILWPNPKQIHEFALGDQNGEAFDLERAQGKWTFWFFGYTHCPDVCPITLSVMNEVDAKLASVPALRRRTQTVFVSVDPARDSPSRLGQYVEFFNAGFLGVTASEERLAALTRQFGILFLPQTPDATGDYLVDHTAAILLTDPQARFVGLFSTPHSADKIEDQFRRIEAFVAAQ